MLAKVLYKWHHREQVTISFCITIILVDEEDFVVVDKDEVDDVGDKDDDNIVYDSGDGDE